MLKKLFGAAVGRRVANSVGTSVGGPLGAAVGYGLASRRLRGAALGGLAVMGGIAAIRTLRREGRLPRVDELNPFRKDPADTPESLPETNGDPMPAYAPHS